jgi:hypothetical protein
MALDQQQAETREDQKAELPWPTGSFAINAHPNVLHFLSAWS